MPWFRTELGSLLLLLLLIKCPDYSSTITQLLGHCTKFISKTVVPLDADVCWRSEWTAPCQPYDWWKRWDLVSLCNVTSEEQAWVSGDRCSTLQPLGAVSTPSSSPPPSSVKNSRFLNYTVSEQNQTLSRYCCYGNRFWASLTRGQSNLTKSASRGANSPVRGHPRGSKVVPLNSWGRVSY